MYFKYKYKLHFQSVFEILPSTVININIIFIVISIGSMVYRR